MNNEQFLIWKQDSIEHYQRMIAWVETQNPDSFSNLNKMRRAIFENWHGPYCIWCNVCYRCNIPGEETQCPLFMNDDQNDELACCFGLWNKMDDSETWREWLIYAKKILWVLENL